MTSPQVSIITAIAPYHRDVAPAAIASAQAQTVPVTVITALDEHLHGAGYTRNRALSKVETPFVVFLDADDWIEPPFVERALAAWRADHYVYANWYEDTTVKVAPACPYTNKSWHPITTLIPTDWLNRVGGFDESLTGAEDTHLYLKLLSSGCCGLHLKEPLFHYGAGGRRAKAFMQSPAYHTTMERFTQEFGGKHVGCCGENEVIPQEAPEGQAGDITALALWSGNRHMRGPISGRLYERTGNGKLTKVDPRDMQARPDLWRVAEVAKPLPKSPPIVIESAEPAAVKPYVANGLKEVASVLFHAPVPLSPEEMLAIEPAAVKPDVGALARLTGKG